MLEGELQDFIEEFSDGRIQFGFVRVRDPNTTLPKCVLVGWVCRVARSWSDADGGSAAKAFLSEPRATSQATWQLFQNFCRLVRSREQWVHTNWYRATTSR